MRRDYVHIACRMSAVLASETNGNVEKHYGRQIQLYITGMGGYIRLVNAHSSTNHPQSTHAYFINFFDILSVCRGPKGSHQKMFSRRTRKSNYCQRSSAASFLHNYGKLILSIWLFGYSSIEKAPMPCTRIKKNSLQIWLQDITEYLTTILSPSKSFNA